MCAQALICSNQLIHYQKEGISEKNLVLLHGWGASSEIWKPLLPSLQKSGWSVTMPDLPGFGKSEPPKKTFSVDDYVDVVFEFLEKMKLPSLLALAGHSFGGRIAIKMAIKHPEKFSKLVLIDCAGVSERKTFRNLGLRLLTKAGKKLFQFPGMAKLEPVIRKYFYQLIGSEDYLKASKLNDTMNLRETFVKVIEEDLSEAASKITLPTLLLWGEKDAMTPLADAEKLHQLIKNSQLEILKNAGHFSFLDQPEEFQKALLNFVKNL